MRARSSLLLLLGILLLIPGCGLPRSGPYYSEVTTLNTFGDTDEDFDPLLHFDIVYVDETIAHLTQIDETTNFASKFTDLGQISPATVARGDVLSITIWENIDEGLLNPAGIGATPLPTVKVDERGMIYVPYIGEVRAAGRTLGQIRTEIQNRLAEKTLNPQVNVFPTENRGRLISLQGHFNRPGLYPIEAGSERILAMIANAGGVSEDPSVVRITLRRGDVQGNIWLQDLYDNPRNDVALRTGDALIAERDRRVFTALGAVGQSAAVQFPGRDLSATRALGMVGGLIDAQADPKGIFIFREETQAIAERMFPGRSFTGPHKIAYVIDLTKPGGIFIARDFKLRDNDTLFATSADFTRWQKIVQAISPVVGFSSSVRNLGGF